MFCSNCSSALHQPLGFIFALVLFWFWLLWLASNDGRQHCCTKLWPIHWFCAKRLRSLISFPRAHVFTCVLLITFVAVGMLGWSMFVVQLLGVYCMIGLISCMIGLLSCMESWLCFPYTMLLTLSPIKYNFFALLIGLIFFCWLMSRRLDPRTLWTYSCAIKVTWPQQKSTQVIVGAKITVSECKSPVAKPWSYLPKPFDKEKFFREIGNVCFEGLSVTLTTLDGFEVSSITTPPASLGSPLLFLDIF